MTGELRPAEKVAIRVRRAWEAAISCGPEESANQAAAAIIEQDREAVRAEQAAEIERLKSHLEDAKEIIQKQIKQAAELAKFKALAETLAGALEPVERLEMWSSSAKDSDMVVMSMATVRKMREAYHQYKEATNV